MALDYPHSKRIVIDFYNDYIEKYAFEDLNQMRALNPQGVEGLGASAIPQGIATFALCDLFGYFFDPQTVGQKNPMRIQGFLKQDWFKDFHNSYSGNLQDLLNFIRDAIRSQKSHRFFLPNVFISKDAGLPDQLFIGHQGKLIFNVYYFTDRVVEVIKEIKQNIEQDALKLNDESDNNKIVIRMAERIEQLKLSSAQYDSIIQDLIQQNEFSSTIQIPFRTTNPLG